MSAVVTVIAEQLSERLGHIISEERIAVISAHIAEPIRRAAIASLREPTPEMVWAVCDNCPDRPADRSCNHCPTWEQDPNYGKVQRGCYALAREHWQSAIDAALSEASQPKGGE